MKYFPHLAPLSLATAALLFSGCAGDNYTTRQSAPQPSRQFAAEPADTQLRRDARRPQQFVADRVYEITGMETSTRRTGEWRAAGQTIRQRGDALEFVEFGSGRTVSVDPPFQVTPTSARSDAALASPESDDPRRTTPPPVP